MKREVELGKGFSQPFQVQEERSWNGSGRGLPCPPYPMGSDSVEGAGTQPEFQVMRLHARLESHFLIVGFTRVHTFVTWDSHELTHNLTGSHAQTLPPGRGEH